MKIQTRSFKRDSLSWRWRCYFCHVPQPPAGGAAPLNKFNRAFVESLASDEGQRIILDFKREQTFFKLWCFYEHVLKTKRTRMLRWIKGFYDLQQNNTRNNDCQIWKTSSFPALRHFTVYVQDFFLFDAATQTKLENYIKLSKSNKQKYFRIFSVVFLNPASP